MLGMTPVVGPSAGTVNVQQLADTRAKGDSCFPDAVVLENTRDTQKAALIFFSRRCRRDNACATKRVLAHKTTSAPLPTASTALGMAHSGTEGESVDGKARLKTTMPVVVSSAPPFLTHALTSVPSSIGCMPSSPFASSACASVGSDTDALRVPCTLPSSPPVTSSDDATSWSMMFHTDTRRASPAEAYWVPYDVYLALSAPLLHERTLQDFVATLCCPITLSAEEQLQRVNIDSVFSFLLHGNAVPSPITSAAAQAVPASTSQSPVQSSCLLHWGEHGSPNDNAELICFPLFCVLGAKLCTVSRGTRFISSVHTPKAPIPVRFAMHPAQRGECRGHSGDGSGKATSTHAAVQQAIVVKPGSDAAAASHRHSGGRDYVLLLFTEQLISALPDFPVALLYTTSPTGAVVSAPPAEAATFWDSWQRTPRAVRRNVSYEHIWSVVTLPRLVTMLQRWGVAPAVAMRRLCVRPHNSSTSPLGQSGKPQLLHTTMNVVHPQREEATVAATVPDDVGTLRRLQFSLAELNSCLLESPPSMPKTASPQLERMSNTGSPQHISGISSDSGAAWDFSSSDLGAVPHKGRITPVIRGTEAAVRAPSAPLRRGRRVTAGACGTYGVTTPHSQNAVLNSSDKRHAGDLAHPYNLVGVSGSISAARVDNRSLYGQAHPYDLPLPPPPSAAVSATPSAGRVGFVRSSMLTPLAKRGTPLCNTRPFRFPHVLQPLSWLRLHTPAFLERANGPARATKGGEKAPPPRCPGATKRAITTSNDVHYSHSVGLAHPYEVLASQKPRRLGNRHWRRFSGTGTRPFHQGDDRRGSVVRDVAAELADTFGNVEQMGERQQASAYQRLADNLGDDGTVLSNAAAPAPTPTPPTRNRSRCFLGARQRTEHVNRYLQALVGAAVLRRADPSLTTAGDFLQQQHGTAHRYSTSDHLARAAGATSSCIASGSSGTYKNTKNSLNRSAESGSGGEDMPRRVPVPPPPLQQHQLRLSSLPHANSLLDHQSSIRTPLDTTPCSVTGDAVPAVSRDHAASVSKDRDKKQLCHSNTNGRAEADAALRTPIGAEALANAVANSSSSRGYHSTYATVSALPSEALLPPGQRPLALRVLCERFASCAVATSSEENLPPPLGNDCDSVVDHLTITGASARPLTRSMGGFSAAEGRTSNTRAVSANKNDHRAECGLVTEPVISADLQLHTSALEPTDDAQAVTAPEAARNDGTAAPDTSASAPPVSLGCQPRAASLLSRRMADALADSTLHEGGVSPSFRTPSLLRSTQAAARQSLGGARGVGAAVPPSSDPDSGFLSQWTDTATLLLNLVACVMQSVGRGYAARRDLRKACCRPSSPGECAAISMTIVATAPAVTRLPHHTLVTPDSSLPSSPTASASASPVLPSVHHHRVATAEATEAVSIDRFPGPHRPAASTLMASPIRALATQPSLTEFPTSLRSLISATVVKASTTLSDTHVPARDVSPVVTTTAKSSLQRHNVASQTSPDKISAFLSLTADALHTSPDNLASFSRLRPKQPTCSTDTDTASRKKSLTPTLRHLLAMYGLQRSSTNEDSGTWAPAQSVDVSVSPATSYGRDAAAGAAADAGACASVDAAALFLPMFKYTVSLMHDDVPPVQSSDASCGHEWSSADIHGENHDGEPSGRASGLPRFVGREPPDVFAPPSFLRLSATLKTQSGSEKATPTAFRESTEESVSMMQQQLAGTLSCTVPFLDQALAKGRSVNTTGNNSQRTVSPNEERNSSCRLPSSADEYATLMVGEALLQLQRIGRGYLIRQQCSQSYRERQEKSHDLLHKRACLWTAALLPSATPVEEDAVANGVGGGSTSAGAAVALRGITGLCSASSYPTNDQTHLMVSLLRSTPSMSGASQLLVKLTPGQQCLDSVNGRWFTGPALPSSLLSQAEPELPGPEEVVGIFGVSAQWGDDFSTVAASPGKMTTMVVSPDSAKYIASPSLMSPTRVCSALSSDSPTPMLTSDSLNEPREVVAGCAVDVTVAASGGAQEAGATQAHRGTFPSFAPPTAAVTGSDPNSGDDDIAMASAHVPMLTVLLPSSSAALSVNTNHSERKVQPPTGGAPSPPRPSLLSPASLRVSFSRDSYLPSANPSTLETPVPATVAVAAANSVVDTSIPVAMSASSSKQASLSEGTYLVRSPYRSPSSPFTVQRSPHNDMTSAAVDSNDTGSYLPPRRRFLTALPRADLSPMEGSIVAASGRSARSLNSISSLPFHLSTTATTTSATAQILSTSQSEGMTPQLWVLEGIEGAVMSSDLDSSGDNQSTERRSTTTSSSSSGSDDDDADHDNKGDTFKEDLIHLEGNSERACFVAAEKVLVCEAVSPSALKDLLLLQRIGRGYLCRRHQHFLFMVSISWMEVMLMHRVALGFLTRRRMGLDFFVHRGAQREVAYWERRNRSAVLIQSVVRGFNARQRVKRLQRRVLVHIELLTALEQQNTDE
ncbi:hypothetical protein, unknown function [Leishmania tarentolae]|uniref:Uncharacterized protein n=1 Tax=Leishmania tarentolae TaxID=5689 RepID=A0A640KM88_LEITA|nr:hypothetical protein, unknown function [Leishmania tarentolae]